MLTTQQQPQVEQRWLECQIGPGMFSDEVAVTYPPEGDPRKSVFVAAGSVQGTPGGRGRVSVRLVTRNGTMFAVLPSSDQDIVTVREQDISDR